MFKKETLKTLVRIGIALLTAVATALGVSAAIM